VGFLDEKCIFRKFDQSVIESCQVFSCDHRDLDDFFMNDAHNYSKQLLGKSYCFCLEEDPSVIVCAFTLANDSIKANLIPNNRRKRILRNIPRSKHFKSYPAVLIGRLGINLRFKRRGIGCELMNFIKGWFVDSNNKTGCRFVVVDSYNEDAPRLYYKKNGFEDLFSSEEQEAQNTGAAGQPMKTRLMYFDLLNLSSSVDL
jgi:hypothetical protein